MHPKPAEYGFTVCSLLYGKVFGPLFDDNVVLSRLVSSGMIKCCPDSEIVPRHVYVTISRCELRRSTELGNSTRTRTRLTSRRPYDYFKRFYEDTVLNMSAAMLQTGYASSAAILPPLQVRLPNVPGHGRKWLGDTESAC